jgi:hypothetical protein
VSLFQHAPQCLSADPWADVTGSKSRGSCGGGTSARSRTTHTWTRPPARRPTPIGAAAASRVRRVQPTPHHTARGDGMLLINGPANPPLRSYCRDHCLRDGHQQERLPVRCAVRDLLPCRGPRWQRCDVPLALAAGSLSTTACRSHSRTTTRRVAGPGATATPPTASSSTGVRMDMYSLGVCLVYAVTP